MNRLLLVGPVLAGTGAALLLGACAPAYNSQYRTGRIVSVQTGQEGQLLLGGYGTVAGRNTASISFGQNTYQGEYNVLAADVVQRPVFSAGVAFSNFAPPGYYLSAGTATVSSNLRDGSLIVRNAQGQVISCRFVVDQSNHGNGNCTDRANANYTLQF